MITYVVAEISVEDPEGYEAYRDMATSAVSEYGGRYVARGGTTESLEGAAPAPRVVILEFPNLERARAFYYSETYQAAAAVRQANATSRLFLVEGCVES